MEYKKFVIISYLRSGTHLLRTALESHKEIVCQTEVFNSDNPNLPYSLQIPSQSILDQWVYNDIPPDIRQVGFVLQAYHPHALRAFPGIRNNPNWEDIWGILQDIPKLKIIHLHRENLLKRHLSHLQARSSGQWHNWKAQQLANITLLEEPPSKHIDQYQRVDKMFKLDIKQLEMDFEEVEYWHNYAHSFFNSKECFSLSYENLQHDFDNTCEKIIHFLKVTPAPLSTGVSKLENRQLPDIIDNYTEVKEYFSKTRWKKYFDEYTA